MAAYGKYVLPRLSDLAMRNKETIRSREAWVPQAVGTVLEVGIGSGLNLPHYTREVERVYGVDPSAELQRMARRRVTTGTPPIEFLTQSAEEPLPIADSSIDTVLLTWTLCSIPNAGRALAEMKRVLRADGRLIFIEHSRSRTRASPDGRTGSHLFGSALPADATSIAELMNSLRQQDSGSGN